MANDHLLDGSIDSVISRSDGLVLLGFFIIFLLIPTSSHNNHPTQKESSCKRHHSGKASVSQPLDWPDCCWGRSWLDGAVGVARGWGVSESVIGLTIPAIGSSLPELATSIVAARKGKSDIVIGNVVGSNIFNIFLVLGVSATIKPLPFQVSSNMDESMVVGITIILFFYLQP